MFPFSFQPDIETFVIIERKAGNAETLEPK